jgi:hypothetical protein
MGFRLVYELSLINKFFFLLFFGKGKKLRKFKKIKKKIMKKMKKMKKIKKIFFSFIWKISYTNRKLMLNLADLVCF